MIFSLLKKVYSVVCFLSIIYIFGAFIYLRKLSSYGAWASVGILEFSLILSFFIGIIGLVLILINLYLKKNSFKLLIYFLISISVLILFLILKL